MICLAWPRKVCIEMVLIHASGLLLLLQLPGTCAAKGPVRTPSKAISLPQKEEDIHNYCDIDMACFLVEWEKDDNIKKDLREHKRP
uniref:Uncharacterized protein n=1 Tax=Theropithecus gelada TaxID=9565 RepID=A0A8D2G109_THEGE